MKARDQILQSLEVVASSLKEMSSEVTFVGGAIVALYIDDEAAPEVRPTEDIDCVVEATTLAGFQEFEVKLRSLGFQNDPKGPICRWLYDGQTVDVMSADDTVFGFTNRWYRQGIAARVEKRLPGGATINVFSIPFLIATKFEAFKPRGRGNWMESKDLEDIFALLDGCIDAEESLQHADPEVRTYLAEEFATLDRHGSRDEIVAAYFGSDAAGRSRARRAAEIVGRIARR